ncbi:MAG: peptidoglycan-binding protein [Clostridia bacterium]|nr:peptidoglycan-binding protein [Clostridia bacterium]
MYEQNDKGEAVREIQRYLLELFYDTDSSFPVIINGEYDAATRAAVRNYQEKRGLPATGEVDRTTFDLLYSDYRAARALRLSPVAIPPDTPLPVTVGAAGEGVLNLQRLLNFLAERYGLPERSDTGGVYSYASSVVARGIQRIYRLPEDGAVDGTFYAKMLRDYDYPPLPGITE